MGGAIGVKGERLLRAPSGISRQKPTLETYVQPLCAEDTMSRATIMQGNIGSPVAILRQEYPGFDFSSLEEYCKDNRTDEWWRHQNGPDSYETEASFAQRALEFQQWLAKLPQTKGTRRAIVISHGGFLKECFGYTGAPNCGFRVYDILPDSTVVHLCT